jgi:hypothetical protein
MSDMRKTGPAGVPFLAGMRDATAAGGGGGGGYQALAASAPHDIPARRGGAAASLGTAEVRACERERGRGGAPAVHGA